MKLEICKNFPDATLHAKSQGATSTWVVCANCQFDAWKFRSFFVPWPRPQVVSLDTPGAQYVIIRRSGHGTAFWN